MNKIESESELRAASAKAYKEVLMNIKKHPELKPGETFLMNATEGEFEKMKRDLNRGRFKSIRIGKIAYTGGYTSKAPKFLKFRPVFVVVKTEKEPKKK